MAINGIGGGSPPRPYAAGGASPFSMVVNRVEDSLRAAAQQLIDFLSLFQANGAGPSPALSRLRAQFPKAGLPSRICGTTLDRVALGDPGATPDNLMAKAKSLGFNTVRLGAYWTEVQPNGPGDQNFATLDALMAAAQKYALKVILTVGAKAPSSPEFYIPSWAASAVPVGGSYGADPNYDANVERFVSLVAQRYAKNPALCMWQVENEPFNPSGHNAQRVGAGLVAAEASILRSADGHRRPVMVNYWTENLDDPWLDAAFQVGDLVGIDVYPHIPLKPGETRTRGWADATARAIIDPALVQAKAVQYGKPAIVSELQADDWHSYKANGNDVAKLTRQMQSLGYGDFLFWRLRMNVERDAQDDFTLDDAERRLSKQLIGG